MTATLVLVISALALLVVALVRSPARPRIKGYSLWAIATYIFGLCLLAFYALGVEGIVYPAATRANCAELVGIPISQAATRADFVVDTTFYPPQVTCGYGTNTDVLTSARQSSSWAQYWGAGHVLLVLSPLLAGWGLLWARIDRRRAEGCNMECD